MITALIELQEEAGGGEGALMQRLFPSVLLEPGFARLSSQPSWREGPRCARLPEGLGIRRGHRGHLCRSSVGWEGHSAGPPPYADLGWRLTDRAGRIASCQPCWVLYTSGHLMAVSPSHVIYQRSALREAPATRWDVPAKYSLILLAK